ncbi:hypothetical protein RCL1_008210 [Eukaryota sp. TZLM3-RCL]
MQIMTTPYHILVLTTVAEFYESTVESLPTYDSDSKSKSKSNTTIPILRTLQKPKTTLALKSVPISEFVSKNEENVEKLIASQLDHPLTQLEPPSSQLHFEEFTSAQRVDTPPALSNYYVSQLSCPVHKLTMKDFENGLFKCDYGCVFINKL